MKCHNDKCDNDRPNDKEFCSTRCRDANKCWMANEMAKGGNVRTNKTNEQMEQYA